MAYFDTFLSYSHRDSQRAFRVRDFLTQQGYRVWMDTLSKTGSRFRKEISDALSNSASITTLITENSIQSKEVLDEVKTGLQLRKKIIPVVLSPKSFHESHQWRSLLREVNWGRIKSAQIERNITRSVLEEIARALRRNDDRGCPIIAIYNFKGGVGKTTLSAHLAAQLYREAGKARSVLMIDCDAQSNLTSLFVSRKEMQHQISASNNLLGILEPHRLRADPGIYGKFQIAGGKIDDHDIFRCTCVLHQNQNTDKSFSIIPNCIDAKKYGQPISNDDHGRIFQNFQQAIEKLSYEYDFIILDCNPSATALSHFALEAATDIVIPVKCDKYALDGLEGIDTLFRDMYGLTYSYGRAPQLRQVWTVVNFADSKFLAESNATRAKGTDSEAQVLRELLGDTLLGGRSMEHLEGSVFEARIPKSGFLNPRPAATGPRSAHINVAERLQYFRDHRNARAVTSALRKLAFEIVDKTHSAHTVHEAV